jgi:hypothetical protein
MAISRRDMIRTGVLGGAALLAGIALSRVTRAATLDAPRTTVSALVADGAQPGCDLDRRVAPFRV